VGDGLMKRGGIEILFESGDVGQFRHGGLLSSIAGQKGNDANVVVMPSSELYRFGRAFGGRCSIARLRSVFRQAVWEARKFAQKQGGTAVAMPPWKR
jgi:hypothetical protein